MRRFSLICVLCFAVCVVSIAKQKMEWVDLGLPSGTLWATCNVGAESPTDMGDRFMWGETIPKSKKNGSVVNEYKFLSTKFSAASHKCYSKYNPISHYLEGVYSQSNEPKKYYRDIPIEYRDYKMKLDAEDDAATINCGNEWVMPTAYQLEELLKCADVTRVFYRDYKQTGRPGYLITSKKNGNSIFLPADTIRHPVMDSISKAVKYVTGIQAKYWSNTISEFYIQPNDSTIERRISNDYAIVLYNWQEPELGKGKVKMDSDFRTQYNYIRPVRIKK